MSALGRTGHEDFALLTEAQISVGWRAAYLLSPAKSMPLRHQTRRHYWLGAAASR